MPRTAQRLWRSSSPLGWTSELGLAGAGPVAILAGFSLAAAVGLINDNRSWAEDTALIFFALAVTLLITALRFIIAAQSHLSAPSDYLSWRPEAGRDPDALSDERDRQVADYYIYIDYRGKAVKVFPIGVASALLGLGAGCLNALARHAARASVVTGCIAAAILLLGGVIALLELWDRPGFMFPKESDALARIAAEVEAARARAAAPAGIGASHNPIPRLPAALKSLPLDIPALTTAMGDDFVTPPLLTSSSRTIGEFAAFFPTEDQQSVFRLACQKLAREFGGYSTTRTSVLFTRLIEARERVIVAIHPCWSEVHEKGVPFEVSAELIAAQRGWTLAYTNSRFDVFPEFPLRSASCRLLCGPLSVDVLIGLVASHEVPSAVN
jgi:hypothetical protein